MQSIPATQRIQLTAPYMGQLGLGQLEGEEEDNNQAGNGVDGMGGGDCGS